MPGRIKLRDLTTGEEGEFEFDEFVEGQDPDEREFYDALLPGQTVTFGGDDLPLIEVTRLA